MYKKILISTCFLLLGASCNTNTRTEEPKKQAPVEIQQNTTTTLHVTSTLLSTSTETTKKTEIPLQVSPKSNIASNCDLFPDKLKSCTPYTCLHPFLLNPEYKFQKEIVGMVNGKCKTIEETNSKYNEHAVCNYDQNTRVVIAEYYKKLLSAEEITIEAGIGFEAEGTVDIENENVTSTFKGSSSGSSNVTLDGEDQLNDPLTEAYNNGTCVITE